MTTGHEVTIKFTTRWDRDERGPHPEVEATDYPDWMTLETVRAIENDVVAMMWRNKK